MTTNLLPINSALLPDLHGDSCTLRPLLIDHVTPDYVAWLTNPSVNRFLECRFANHTIKSVRAFVDSQQKSGLALFYGIWALNGPHIGNIKVGPIDGNHLTSEIGFLIGDSLYWNKGIASEAITLIVRFGFEMGLKKITAGCYENNPASGAALKKAGFSHEGFRPDQVFHEGGRFGIDLFGMTCP